ETGTIVFEVDAGAGANALRVSSAGKTGIRTGTPVLDLHITSGDTPAHRLEQTGQSGFTAQTWDIAGNEANFFVRDVTGGSRLPFRVRPGAPTSSIDISASGNVGFATSAAQGAISVASANTGVPGGAPITWSNKYSTFGPNVGSATGAALGLGYDTTGDSGILISVAPNTAWKPMSYQAISHNFYVLGGATASMMLNSSGSVGIGTTAPTQLLSVNGTAGKPGGGTWDVFSDERLKNIKGRYTTGLKALMQLQPLRYEYKPNNPLGIKLEG